MHMHIASVLIGVHIPLKYSFPLVNSASYNTRMHLTIYWKKHVLASACILNLVLVQYWSHVQDITVPIWPSILYQTGMGIKLIPGTSLLLVPIMIQYSMPTPFQHLKVILHILYLELVIHLFFNPLNCYIQLKFIWDVYCK